MKLIWHELALEELASLGEKTYDLFGKSVSDRVVVNLIDRESALATNPFLGTEDERYSPFRILHSWHNRVFYLIGEGEIKIIAIWDNRRNEKELPKILSSRS